MRILMLTSSYPKFPGDGTAPFIERIARGVAACGHAVDLVLPRHPDLVVTGRNGDLPLRFFPYYAGPPKHYAWGYSTSMQADRHVKPSALLVAPLAFLSGFVTTRRLLGRESYDLVHAHWVLPSGPIGALAALTANLPLMVSLHGSDIFMAEQSGVLRAVTSWVLRRSELVTACSRDLAERARSIGGLDLPLLIHPYGVDADELASGDSSVWRARAGAAADEILVVGLGRLVAKKGFDDLIHAAAILRGEGSRVRVAIGGAGDLADALAAKAREHRCEDAVRLLGNVPHDQVGAFLRAADVVAVPSVRDENGNVDGLPNVLLEGMAAGRPVVATRIAGIPDVVEHGSNGLLVPPRDAQALAGALRLLEQDSRLRVELAEAAERSARAMSWAAYSQRLLAGYEAAVGNRRAN